MAEVIVRPAAPKAFEEFGTSVAGSRNTVIVGASAGGNGRAYVFVWDGSSWVEQAQLQSPTPNVYEYGKAVALDGDCAVVGAPSGGVQGSGQVYVYRRAGTSWAAEATLAAGGPPGFDAFGRDVSLDGEQLIVGSNHAAYVFRRSGTIWSAEAMLTPPSATAGSGACSSVGIHGDHAVVGNEWGGAATNQGAVGVFRRNGAAWDLVQPVLTAPDATTYDHFGAAVAIRDGRLIVGAPGVSGGGVADAGAAYVYTLSGATWGLEGKLEPPSQGAHLVHDFGAAVSLDGDYALVGNPSDHIPDPGSGSACLFKRTGSRWTLVPPVLRATSNVYWFAYFGRAVSVSDAGVFVGAPEARAPDYDNGLLYYYALPADFRNVLRADRDWSRYADILWGVIRGGPGVIVKPGSGPVPVDPEPFIDWRELAPDVRARVLGEALSRIGENVDDRKLRERVAEVAKAVAKRAEQKG
jgi:hypothetical protein